MACAYYLRRTELDYVILDKQSKCGGSWQETWDSLSLFSPAEYSSLPGWLMPKSHNEFPSRDEVVDYLCKYEERYKFPIERPVEVYEVTKEKGVFQLKTSKGDYFSKAMISATGIWENPFQPLISEQEKFKGKQLHTVDYRNPSDFQGKKVLVVGEGNSGAQILADVSKVCRTSWATLRDPEFLPDDVDGRVLFDVASAKYHAEQKGEKFDFSKYNLGSIVMVPSVKQARERKVLSSAGTIKELFKEGVVWSDGRREDFDVIIWCTGFGYATKHLADHITPDTTGKIRTKGTRAEETEGLWLVGYGNWTGFASATIIGVGRSAKQTVKEIEGYIKNS